MARDIILMMDSFGIGGAKDASAFGDEGANTLYNIAKEKFDNGDYVLGDLNEYGQHFRIYFKLKGKRDCLDKEFNCHIGCVAWPNARIKIATPLLKDDK